MDVTKGINCYASLEEAETYFEKRIDATPWMTAVADRKKQALTSACILLEELEWVGSICSTSQSLAFPRVGFYYDPRLGQTTELSGYPDRLLTATFEMALHLLANEDLVSDTGGAKAFSLAGLNLTSIQKAAVYPSVVKRVLRPLLSNSSRTWWRAN